MNDGWYDCCDCCDRVLHAHRDSDGVNYDHGHHDLHGQDYYVLHALRDHDHGPLYDLDIVIDKDISISFLFYRI